MEHKAKFNSEQQQHVGENQTAQQSAREFPTPEELLRYDAAQTPVPAAVAERLQRSVGQSPAPSRSWWRRFFGGNQ
jgi:hypothetical protein